MPRANDFPPIDSTDQVQTLTLDCGINYLPTGVTLTGTPTITLSVVSGTDAAVATRLDGSANVGTAPAPRGSNRANCAMTQRVKNIQNGVEYLIKGVCDRSDGDKAELWCHFRGKTPA